MRTGRSCETSSSGSLPVPGHPSRSLFTAVNRRLSDALGVKHAGQDLAAAGDNHNSALSADSAATASRLLSAQRRCDAGRASTRPSRPGHRSSSARIRARAQRGRGGSGARYYGCSPGMRVAPGVAKQYRPVCKAAVSLFTGAAAVATCNNRPPTQTLVEPMGDHLVGVEPGGLAAAGGRLEFRPLSEA